MIKKLEKFTPILTIIILVIIWYIMASIINTEIVLPSPTLVIVELGKIFTTSGFYLSLAMTILRGLLSFCISLILAVIFGVLSYQFEFFYRLFYPLIIIVRATPTMSVIFLCLLWFKSWFTPLFVSTAVIFPTLYTSVYNGISSTDKRLVEMSKIYNVPKKVQITKLFLPWAFNEIFSSGVNALSLNIKLIIAAEALAQTKNSIGGLMNIAKLNTETSSLFAYTICAIVISFLLELLLNGIRNLIRGLKDAKRKQYN